MTPGRCNEISLDVAALLLNLEEVAQIALTAEAEELQRIMRREAGNKAHGDGPGKPVWRDAIQSSIEARPCSNGATLEYAVGYFPRGLSEKVRALVVVEGGGLYGSGTRIQAGPTGRVVWDDDIAGQHPSLAKAQYYLPDGFNQKGNDFVANSLRMMRVRFGVQIESIMRSLPDRLFFQQVNVKGG